METTDILVLKSSKGFTSVENISDIDTVDVIDSGLDDDLSKYLNQKSVPVIRIKLKNGQTYYYEALAWTMSYVSTTTDNRKRFVTDKGECFVI